MTEYVVEIEIPGLDRLRAALKAFDRTPKELLQQALPVLKILAPILADPLGMKSDATAAGRTAKKLDFSINDFAGCLEDFLTALRTGNLDNVVFIHRWFSSNAAGALGNTSISQFPCPTDASVSGEPKSEKLNQRENF